jgi:hypothetical protein
LAAKLNRIEDDLNNVLPLPIVYFQLSERNVLVKWGKCHLIEHWNVTKIKYKLRGASNLFTLFCEKAFKLPRTLIPMTFPANLLDEYEKNNPTCFD